MLKNCDECNKVFSHPTRSLCQECYEMARKSFDAVKNYLQENPGASVAQVAKDTEVALDLIYEYIREGRLDVVPKDASLHCSICGDPISVGRVCPSCRADLRSTIKTGPPKITKSQEQARDAKRVHTLDRIKER